MFSKRRKLASEEGETSSAISKEDYEVFLSFRGPDTRQGFTDCFYHAMVDAGIRVFRDDDELGPGAKIDEILHAIENSKICIVVLSPTFAESAWCLREVERMVDMKKDIVPIFYRVTPNDVKLQTGPYATAQMVHEVKYGKERVQQWREALKEILTIKGRELKNTGYGEFSRQVAKEILTKLKVKHKYEIKNLVEVPDEVEAALELLDIGSGGRRVLGIHGMGGIGKTTLAKIIFNQILARFDCSCFLESIRDYTSQGPDGLYKLQEWLLKSLDPSMRDNTQIVDPMKMIQTIFQRKKVVIVLDDVDQQSHLDSLVGDSSWFGNGSRIIFTTRNAELYEETNSSNTDFYSMEKKEMNSKQALKLFSKHAFGEDSPPKDFEHLSVEAISTTGGLPLALEVVGSLLHRRKAKVWRESIKKLKESPHEDVQRKLKLTYDALEYEQQEIFLDIACFFIGAGKANAIYMWEACEFYPNNGIEVLISMSLIKLNEKKCFCMHDQLRDLGRAIVKVNSIDVRAGSRLWMRNNALDLLKRKGGKEKVEALHLDGASVYLDRENFVGLEKLRFLWLSECVNICGDFGGLIPKLRWLSLRFDAHVTNLSLRELVVLELSYCSFDEIWPGWGQILVSQQLKVLTLSHCDELISTPDLSKVVNLEKLVVDKCGKLTSLHSSVGKLQCLRRLIIVGCYSLHEFPEELTSLESLKQILLHCWSTLSRNPLQLPVSIGCLVSLTRLELERVVHLPNSLGELVKLKYLSLRYSHDLLVLPDSIGDLRSLIHLDLSNTMITELPATIGQLTKLESLDLSDCERLQRLPDSLGNLQSLVDLNMSNCSSIAELPHSFVNLSSLQNMYMCDCHSIVELPHSFGNLSSLQKLHLMDSSIRSLPDSIIGLEKLERLDIGDNSGEYWITEVSELPSGLTCLNVKCVQKIHNLSNLINLSELEINNAAFLSNELVEFEGIENLSKLKRLSIECINVHFLSMEWGALQQLTSLKLWCPSLEFGQCQLPWSLESLDLHVNKWGQLPSNLSSLKNLSSLMLCNFVIEEADLVEGLESLEVLKMSRCILKFNDFPVLKRLRNLILDNCRSHITSSPVADYLDEQLPVIGSEFQIQLSNLKNLSELDLSNFSIRDDDGFKVVGVEGLESSIDLHMKEYILFEFTHNVSVLRSLTSLRLYNCSFPPMTCLDIPQLDHLTYLNIFSSDNLVEIQGIGMLKSLTNLYIGYCPSLQWIEGLSELKGLEFISIFSCHEFDGIDGVDRLLSAETLSELIITDCKCKDVQYLSRKGKS